MSKSGVFTNVADCPDDMSKSMGVDVVGEAIRPPSCRSSYGKITHLLNLSNQGISAPACTEPMDLFFSWKSSSYNCYISSAILFHFGLFVFLHLNTNHQHDHLVHSNISSPGLYNWASWVKSGSKNAFNSDVLPTFSEGSRCVNTKNQTTIT